MQDDTTRSDGERMDEDGSEGSDGGTDDRNQRETAADDREPFLSHLSDVQDFFNEFVSGFRGFPSAAPRQPRYDMVRTDAEYVILLDVPGVAREMLEVNAVGDELTISGERSRPVLAEGAELVRSERGFGRFRRTIRLPSDIEVTAVRAKLDAGVLRVTLPRRGGAGKQTIDIEE